LGSTRQAPATRRADLALPNAPKITTGKVVAHRDGATVGS
jgi:hypothetical protein